MEQPKKFEDSQIVPKAWYALGSLDKGEFVVRKVVSGYRKAQDLKARGEKMIPITLTQEK